MDSKHKIKLAIIGSRGFLVDYGGYETFIKHLAIGLKDKNISLTIFGIKNYRNPANDNLYPEIKRIWLPTIRLKFLEKVIPSLLAVLWVCFSKVDIIFSISVSPGLLLFIPRICGKKVVVNPDGLEWKRPKWSKFIAFWLRLSEVAAIYSSNLVIADSMTIANYIKNKYKGKRVIYIPYGADINLPDANDRMILEKYGLKPNQYYLQVCRLEPENNAHIVIREFNEYKGHKELIIIGDTPHSLEYKENLKKSANNKIRFLGSVYGDDFKVILRNTYCYIHGHEAGGTNPALLEAMASARCPLVMNVPYNIEVVKESGFVFTKERGNLAERLEFLDTKEDLIKTLGQKALDHIKLYYAWENVISAYYNIFSNLYHHQSFYLYR